MYNTIYNATRSEKARYTVQDIMDVHEYMHSYRCFFVFLWQELHGGCYQRSERFVTPRDRVSVRNGIAKRFEELGEPGEYQEIERGANETG